MGSKEDSKTEKEIIDDLEEVHESIKNDSSKKFDPDEVKPQIDDLAEQIKSSDADSDEAVSGDLDEKRKQEQNRSSDAGKA